MNKQEIDEVIQAVDNINNQLEEQLYSERYGQDPWVYVEVRVGSADTVVMFLGECLYNSENEERQWVEDGPSILHDSGVCTDDLVPAHYEPIEGYLRKQIMSLLEKLTKIKL